MEDRTARRNRERQNYVWGSWFETRLMEELHGDTLRDSQAIMKACNDFRDFSTGLLSCEDMQQARSYVCDRNLGTTVATRRDGPQALKLGAKPTVVFDSVAQFGRKVYTCSLHPPILGHRCLCVLVKPDGPNSDPDLFISTRSANPADGNYQWKSQKGGSDYINIDVQDPNFEYGQYWICVTSTSGECAFQLQVWQVDVKGDRERQKADRMAGRVLWTAMRQSIADQTRRVSSAAYSEKSAATARLRMFEQLTPRTKLATEQALNPPIPDPDPPHTNSLRATSHLKRGSLLPSRRNSVEASSPVASLVSTSNLAASLGTEGAPSKAGDRGVSRRVDVNALTSVKRGLPSPLDARRAGKSKLDGTSTPTKPTRKLSADVPVQLKSSATPTLGTLAKLTSLSASNTLSTPNGPSTDIAPKYLGDRGFSQAMPSPVRKTRSFESSLDGHASTLSTQTAQITSDLRGRCLAMENDLQRKLLKATDTVDRARRRMMHKETQHLVQDLTQRLLIIRPRTTSANLKPTYDRETIHLHAPDEKAAPGMLGDLPDSEQPRTESKRLTALQTRAAAVFHHLSDPSHEEAAQRPSTSHLILDHPAAVMNTKSSDRLRPLTTCGLDTASQRRQGSQEGVRAERSQKEMRGLGWSARGRHSRPNSRGDMTQKESMALAQLLRPVSQQHKRKAARMLYSEADAENPNQRRWNSDTKPWTAPNPGPRVKTSLGYLGQV